MSYRRPLEHATGGVAINGAEHNPLAPFGGVKQSRNAREFGVWGFDEVTTIKVVNHWDHSPGAAECRCWPIRLSDDPDVSVCPIEAGGSDHVGIARTPLASSSSSIPTNDPEVTLVAPARGSV